MLVQDLLNPVPHKRENLHRSAQLTECWIFLILVRFKKIKDGTDRIQTLLQTKYLLGHQVGSLHLCLFQCLTIIDKMLNGEVIFTLIDLPEFLHQFQLVQYGFMIAHKHHLIDPFPSRIKEAMCLDQLTYAVKTNFRFKLFRVDQIKFFCPSKVTKKGSPL